MTNNENLGGFYQAIVDEQLNQHLARKFYIEQVKLSQKLYLEQKLTELRKTFKTPLKRLRKHKHPKRRYTTANGTPHRTRPEPTTTRTRVQRRIFRGARPRKHPRPA